MSEPITYGKALYYPHIEFNDNRWLKTAALYYDALFRIVPEGYKANDSRTVKALIDNFDFVQDLKTKDEAEIIARPFLSWLKREFLDESRRERLFKKLILQAKDQEPTLIHMNKMGQLLKDELPKLKMASAPVDRHADFYQFEPATAAIYMTYLANRLAEDRKVPIVTDNAFYHPLVQGMQAPNNNREDLGAALARVVISTAVPHDLADIPLKKIIKFRKNYKDEREQFYQSVNEMVKSFKDVGDEGAALQDIINQKHKLITISVNNLKRSCNSLGITTAVGLFSLSIPAIVSGAGAVAAGVAVAGMATAKGISAFIDYRKTKVASPHAYVLSLRRLRKETLTEQLLKGKLLL